jgi:hypothetical protein
MPANRMYIGGSGAHQGLSRLSCNYAMWEVVPGPWQDRPTAWSPVLAALRLEEALSQVVGEADDSDGDAVVLECPGGPGSRGGQERRCGQPVAQA